MRRLRWGWFWAWAFVVVAGLADRATADDLPRAGRFGAAAAPITDELRRERNLGDVAGLVLREILPGTAAEAAGLRAGDVLTRVDGEPIADAAAYVARLGRRRAGETVAIAFVRDGKEQKIDVVLRPRPMEAGGENHDVLYDSVASRGGRLRTIVTRPKAAGAHPALMIIQGLGGFSVESLPGQRGYYADFVDDFAARGYVTFRVEKAGQGDSEGGPTRDVDFETELDGYRQALKALKSYDFVDKDNIVIFGHSMGGMMGPVLAAESPVRGVAVYGTASKTWGEYLLENTRRQLALAGTPAGEIDAAMRQEAAINQAIYADGRTPEDLAAARPDLAPRVNGMFAEGKYYAGRHYVFFRQLAATNLADAWERFDGHALAVWGKSDFVSAEADHALIARIVDQARPGHGRFLAMDGIDHGFLRRATPEDSFAGSGPGEFDPAIVATLRDWAARIIAKRP